MSLGSSRWLISSFDSPGGSLLIINVDDPVLPIVLYACISPALSIISTSGTIGAPFGHLSGTFRACCPDCLGYDVESSSVSTSLNSRCRMQQGGNRRYCVGKTYL